MRSYFDPMKKWGKRLVAFAIAFAMVMTSFAMNPLTAYADEADIAIAEKKEAVLQNTLDRIREHAEENGNPIVSNGVMTQYERDYLDLELGKESNSEFLDLDSLGLSEEDQVKILIIMEEESVLEQNAQAEINEETRELSDELRQGQQDVLDVIAEDVLKDAEWTITDQYTWLLNGVAASVPYGTLGELEKVEGVKSVLIQTVYEIMEEEPYTNADGVMIGREETWASGYTGKGTQIAIIDTGIDDDHPSFAPLPELSAEDAAIYDRTDVEDIENVLDMLHANSEFYLEGVSASDLYFNSKIAYGFNYCDHSTVINHSALYDYMGDHGTHVAGIAAANDLGDGGAVGVAPDAQLYVMKVFGVNGGAYTADILAALEDALILGADVINMSLGSPAGFTTDVEEINAIYESIANYRTLVFVSAGNENNAGENSAWGVNQYLTSNPDNAVIASPGIYENVNSVASVNNLKMMSVYLGVAGQYLSYYESLYSNASILTLSGEEYPYVIVDNLGQTLEDYQNAGVEGKIAVVSRGTNSFVEKHQLAQDAGAIACVIYNNEGTDLFGMDLTDATATIPCVSVAKPTGEFLAAALAEDPEAKMYISGVEQIPGVDAGKMSIFSSWGPTPSLTLEPDITAPGGNIYSTLDGGTYGVMSGTSMASPNAAGVAALVLQYIKETYGELEPAELRRIANGLLYSTAVPVEYEEDLWYSPRSQGTGLINAYKAVNSKVILTVEGMDVPKVELGDDVARTGKYTFTFGAENLDAEMDQYFDVSANAQSEGIERYSDGQGGYVDFMSGTPVALYPEMEITSPDMVLTYDYTENGKTTSADARHLYLKALESDLSTDDQFFRYNLNEDEAANMADVQAYLDALVQQPWMEEDVLEEESLKVAAGESASVTVTLELPAEEQEFLKSFENGIYVEGYAMLDAKNQSGIDLSLPYLGFYGDWTEAPVFDSGYYVGSDNQYMYFDEYTTYPNMMLSYAGMYTMMLGDNPYLYDEYDERYISLSPNDDGYFDYIAEITLGMLRNAKVLTISYEDAETGKLYYELTVDAVRKSITSIDEYGEYVTNYFSLYELYYNYGDIAYYYLVDDAGKFLPNNTKLNLTVSAQLDYDAHEQNNDSDTWTVPITVDLEAPVMSDAAVTVAEDGTQTLDMTFSDNVGVAAVYVMNAKTNLIMRSSGVEHVDNGAENHLTLDVTECGDEMWIVLCDYAMNESLYKIETTNNEKPLDLDDFYAYRQYSDNMNSNVIIGWAALDSETAELTVISADDAMETAIVSADYVDGHIVACDFDGNIVYINPGQWSERTYITHLPKNESSGRNYYADCMAFDPTTGTLYAYSFLAKTIYAIDMATAEISVVNDYVSDSVIAMSFDEEGNWYCITSGDSYYGTGPQLKKIVKSSWSDSYYVDYSVLYQFDGIYTTDYQTMAYNPADDCMYWAAYFTEYDPATETLLRDNMLYRINTNGSDVIVEAVGKIGVNDQLVGMFKMDDRGYTLPEVAVEDVQVELNTDRLDMMVETQSTLVAGFDPWYMPLEIAGWSSSDETVAVVSQDGTVTAVAPGTATITVKASNGSTASCEVFVANIQAELHAFIGYGNTLSNQWITMPAWDLSLTEVVTVPGNVEYVAGEYVDGQIYAYNTTGEFYRVDAETREGVKLSEALNGKEVLDLAYDYTTGYMYALTCVSDGYYYYDTYLELVDLNTGVLTMLGLVMTENADNIPKAIAVSTEGTMYIVQANGNLNTCDPADCTLSLIANTGYHAPYMHALAYDHDHGGLYWSMGLAHIIYVDEQTGNAMEIGSLTEAASAVAMFIIPENEPAAPEIPVESVTMLSDEVVLMESMKTSVPVEVLPLNATDRNVVWTVEDPSVAVIENGVITALKAGETKATGVLGDFTVEMTVKVLPTTGELYAYLLYEIGSYTDDNAWIAMTDNDMIAGYTKLTEMDANPMLSAAYYNGKIYAFEVVEEYSYVTWEYVYEYLLHVIDPATMTKESTVELTQGAYLCDMTFNYAMNTMYAIGSDSASGAATVLYMINPVTGECVAAADLADGLIALTSKADGTMYGMSVDGVLYTVDAITGVLTEIGATGYTANSLNSSMAYDHTTGNLYWVQNDENSGHLLVVDTEDASALNLGYVGEVGAEVAALIVIPDEEPETGTPVLSGLKLNKDAMVLAAGSQSQLKVTLLPVSITPVEGVVSFTTSDEAVATVDENGVVTAVGKGTAVITASCGEYSASCQVQVVGNEKLYLVTDTGVQTSPLMTPDSAEDLFTIDDEDLTILTMTWSVEDECYYAVCTDYDLDDYYLVKIGADGSAALVDENQKIFGVEENAADYQYPIDDVVEENIDLTYNPYNGKLYMLMAVETYDYDLWEGEDVYMIYTVDPQTGASAPLVRLPEDIFNPNEIVFISENELVVLDYGMDSFWKLTLDAENKSLTGEEMSLSGDDYTAYSQVGIVYNAEMDKIFVAQVDWYGDGELFTLDPVTGTVERIGDAAYSGDMVDAIYIPEN